MDLKRWLLFTLGLIRDRRLDARGYLCSKIVVKITP